MAKYFKNQGLKSTEEAKYAYGNDDIGDYLTADLGVLFSYMFNTKSRNTAIHVFKCGTTRTSNLRINHAELRTTSAEFRINYAEFRKNMQNFCSLCAEFRMNMRNSAKVSQYAEFLLHFSSETFPHQQWKNQT